MPHPNDNDPTYLRARDGDEAALAELFDHQRERLRRMVRLRIDRRLAGRVDPEDVLQEAYLEVRRRFPDYVREHAAELSLPLWLRMIATERLHYVHRFHLGAQIRDASRDVALQRGVGPDASSATMAVDLVASTTTASRAASRDEQYILLREALERMDDHDREILALRHFEQLSNDEVAHLLGLKKSTASQRYVRALKRIKDVLGAIPGFDPTF